MSTCTRQEPIPTEFHLPGTLLSSPGAAEIYEVVSYPVCRLYEDQSITFEKNGIDFKHRFQPNAFEYRANKKKDQGNYLSYLVRHVSIKTKAEFYITDHCLKKVYVAEKVS